MIENLTNEEVRELLESVEGLIANAFGAKNLTGGKWVNKDCNVYSTSRVGWAELDRYLTGWRITNCKKIRKTALSDKMYCGNVLKDDGKWLYIKDNK